MNKSTLRKKYLDQRLALSDESYKEENQQLVNLFFTSVDLSEIRCLHVFLPIVKFKEVDTWRIIERIEQEYPHIKLVIPKVIGDNLEHYLYKGKEQLVTNKWEIPEPKTGQVISPSQIDMVLMPLVIADQQGNRIGYGKGYYDRFLSQCQSSTQKIGLSLLPLIEESIDSHACDVKLDRCATPKSFVSFR